MARLRILLGDDHTIVRQGLRKIIEAQPEWEVVAEASDGREAVRLAAENSPDVAILDIGMPLMDGYEVARRIRARRGKAVRLIALTGWGQEEDKRLSQEAGFDLHLVKPVEPAALENLLAGLRVGTA